MWEIYNNGNYTVFLNTENGTKIRYNNSDVLICDRPESMDVKITNKCNHGCLFCHENSISMGQEATYSILKEFAANVLPYTEIACLAENTIVHSENGAIEIGQLKIGDKIYDNEGVLRTVIDINVSTKEAIKLKGRKGFSVTCSKDHPFMVNNKQIKAEECLNKAIDELKIEKENNIDKVYYIDMAQYIHKPNKNPKTGGGSAGGAIIDDYTIRLTHSTSHIPRYVVLNSDIMWLYGLFAAEGSTKGLTLNINEKDFAKKAKSIWKNIFNLDTTIREREDKNAMEVNFHEPSHIEDLFVKAMKIGKGARNKSLCFLYGIENKELIRQALLGLWQGDGCIRTRVSKNGKSKTYSASLKTTSKYLAYDVAYLLAKWFGIKASIHHGISSTRKIEGRTVKSSDYYSVEFYGYQKCVTVFPEYTKYQKPIHQPMNRKTPLSITLIEEAPKQKLYDITLDKGTHIFPINGYVLTHNCGGGNLMCNLEHTEFFLKELQKAKAIPSITVQQQDFIEFYYIIKKWIEEKLVYGVGVSVDNPTNSLLHEYLQDCPNAVIHTIVGMYDENYFKPLINKGYKILFLGFKRFRRGSKYYQAKEKFIQENTEFLNNNIVSFNKAFKVISFDNLALEQLNMKEKVSQKMWDTLYCGDDGCFTFYVDLVEQTYALNSMTLERQPINGQTPVEMFKDIRSRYGNQH